MANHYAPMGRCPLCEEEIGPAGHVCRLQQEAAAAAARLVEVNERGYGRCPRCEAWAKIATHTCKPLWSAQVWLGGETEEEAGDPFNLRANSPPRAAAEKAADHYFTYLTDWVCSSGQKVSVKIWPADDPDQAQTFYLEAELYVRWLDQDRAAVEAAAYGPKPKFYTL